MGDPRKVKITRRGGVTIPQELRQEYDLEEGDVLTLIDLDGTFVVKPGTLQVDRLAGRIRNQLEEEGESLQSVLADLQTRRETGGD